MLCATVHNLHAWLCFGEILTSQPRDSRCFSIEVLLTLHFSKCMFSKCTNALCLGESASDVWLKRHCRYTSCYIRHTSCHSFLSSDVIDGIGWQSSVTGNFKASMLLPNFICQCNHCIFILRTNTQAMTPLLARSTGAQHGPWCPVLSWIQVL